MKRSIVVGILAAVSLANCFASEPILGLENAKMVSKRVVNEASKNIYQIRLGKKRVSREEAESIVENKLREINESGSYEMKACLYNNKLLVSNLENNFDVEYTIKYEFNGSFPSTFRRFAESYACVVSIKAQGENTVLLSRKFSRAEDYEQYGQFCRTDKILEANSNLLLITGESKSVYGSCPGMCPIRGKVCEYETFVTEQVKE